MYKVNLNKHKIKSVLDLPGSTLTLHYKHKDYPTSSKENYSIENTNTDKHEINTYDTPADKDPLLKTQLRVI